MLLGRPPPVKTSYLLIVLLQQGISGLTQAIQRLPWRAFWAAARSAGEAAQSPALDPPLRLFCARHSARAGPYIQAWADSPGEGAPIVLLAAGAPYALARVQAIALTLQVAPTRLLACYVPHPDEVDTALGAVRRAPFVGLVVIEATLAQMACLVKELPPRAKSPRRGQRAHCLVLPRTPICLWPSACMGQCAYFG